MKNILNNIVTDSNSTTLEFLDRNRYITEYRMANYKRIPVNRYICISLLFSKDELPCIYHCGAKKELLDIFVHLVYYLEELIEKEEIYEIIVGDNI